MASSRIPAGSTRSRCCRWPAQHCAELRRACCALLSALLCAGVGKTTFLGAGWGSHAFMLRPYLMSRCQRMQTTAGATCALSACLGGLSGHQLLPLLIAAGMLGAMLAKLGITTILVDADPQGRCALCTLCLFWHAPTLNTA